MITWKNFEKPSSWRPETRLLDLQLWCFGKDITRPAGNLLLEYGLERQAAPVEDRVPSIYKFCPCPSQRLLLRGYGLFFWG